MSAVIDCYTGYYIETGTGAVCGIVLCDGGSKRPELVLCPQGDYLNGLLELLIRRVTFWKGKLDDYPLQLRVHVHHKNANFKKVLDKSIKAAATARGYKGTARDHIVKHTLIRKDYHKPACYEQMERLAGALIDINEPHPCLVVTACNDSQSADQLAVYTICQGEWNRVRGGRSDGDAAGVAGAAAREEQNRGAANDDEATEDEVAIAGN